MQFAQPIWLVAGFAACAALLWQFRRFDARQRAALAVFASGHLLAQLTASFSKRRQTMKRALFITGAALLFVALARPQWGFRWEETKRKGIDILFAVDTSKSMLAQDVKPDRLTHAKLAVTDLVNKLEGDRIGLIAFAGSAFLQSPLTLDYDAFRQALDAVDTGIIPRGGTNVASAIHEAREAFGEGTNSQKLLVLITDGEDLEAQGIEAARAAAKDGMKIYTVGVGHAAGELIPLQSEGGSVEFARDEAGQFVRSRLDEATLKQIAETTGGLYEPLGQQGEGLESIYQQGLAPLPKQELSSRMQKVYIERFQWPLAAGLACLLVELLIGTRKTRGLRRFLPVPVQRREGKRTPAAMALSLIALSATLQASPQSAERAYEKGRFDAALDQYAQAVEKHPDQAALQFNLGAAAFKSGEFEKAAPAFQKTLQTDQLALQQKAYYNLGNTQYRLGQKTQKEQPQETIERWQAAVQSYEAALKLNADDADAKFNRDLVKKRLEELQNQQQDKQDKQDKNDPQKQDQEGGNSEKQDQNGQTPKQDNESAKKDPEQSGSQNEDEQKSQPEPKEGDGKEPQPEKPDQQQQPGKEGEGEKEAEKGKGDPQPLQANNEPAADGKAGKQPSEAERVPGEMTKQEARQLLDSLKKGDRRMPIEPAARGAGAPENQQPGKDW